MSTLGVISDQLQYDHSRPARWLVSEPDPSRGRRGLVPRLLVGPQFLPNTCG